MAQAASNLAEWVAAVIAVKSLPRSREKGEAAAMIHNTPPERRSEFAKEVWRIRRENGMDRAAPLGQF